MHVSVRDVAKVLLLAGPLTLAGCHRAPAPKPVDKAVIEAQILKLDRHWIDAAAKHDADKWVYFYSDDAVVLPPNEKTLTDKASIHTEITQLLSAPGLNLTWTNDKVVVADAGDMAYTYGEYTLTLDGKGGKPVTDKGKVLEIWRQQDNGSWKCTVDTWSSDLPAPTA